MSTSTGFHRDFLMKLAKDNLHFKVSCISQVIVFHGVYMSSSILRMSSVVEKTNQNNHQHLILLYKTIAYKVEHGSIHVSAAPGFKNPGNCVQYPGG